MLRHLMLLGYSSTLIDNLETQQKNQQQFLLSPLVS